MKKRYSLLFNRLVIASLFVFSAPSSSWAKETGKKQKQATAKKKTQKTARSRTNRASKQTASKQTASKQTASKQRKLFIQANQFYNKGQYAKAAALFQKLAKRPNWKHFAVFYNLGNCYFRLQEYGRALAFYRKAQKLQPNHLDLLHNIQLLYQRLGKSDQTVPRLRLKFLFWYYLLNLKQLFFLVIFMTCIGLLLWGFHIRQASLQNKKGLRWYVVTWMSIVLILWLSLGIKVYQEEFRQIAVITQDQITARSGYGTQFEPLFRLNQADEVLIKERIQLTDTKKKTHEWLKVEIYLYDKQQKRRIKQIGWIPSRAVEEI